MNTNNKMKTNLEYIDLIKKRFYGVIVCELTQDVTFLEEKEDYKESIKYLCKTEKHFLIKNYIKYRGINNTVNDYLDGGWED